MLASPHALICLRSAARSSTFLSRECEAWYAFDFLLVRLLQRGKTPNVKWLEDVRGVRRHTEGNNLAFLAEILEFKRLVALVAVNNQ